MATVRTAVETRERFRTMTQSESNYDSSCAIEYTMSLRAEQYADSFQTSGLVCKDANAT